MTDTAGPFDSAAWAEAQWYRHAPAWSPSGVYGTEPATSTSTGDLPFSSSGLNVTIGTGRANVRGAGFERSGTPSSQAVATNGNANSRRDRIVLRRDLGAHTLTPTLIQGTPAGSPSAPAVTRNDTVWDLPLFSFIVPASNGTTISSVRDERTFIDPGSGRILLPHRSASASYSGGTGESRIDNGSIDFTMTQFLDDAYAYRAVLQARIDGNTASADLTIRFRAASGTAAPTTSSTAIGANRYTDAGGTNPDIVLNSLAFVPSTMGLYTIAPFILASAGTTSVESYGGMVPARLEAWLEYVGPARSSYNTI